MRDWVPVSVAARRLDVQPRSILRWIKSRALRAKPKNPHARRREWLVEVGSIDELEAERSKRIDTGWA